MKFSNSYQKVIIGYTLTLLITVSALGIAGCQTTDSTGSSETGGATNVNQVIVYGKVNSIPLDRYNVREGQIQGMSVAIIPHKYPCSDSTGESDAITRQAEFMRIMKTDKSAAYKSLFYAVVNGSKHNAWGFTPCYTAFVAAYDSAKTGQEALSYSRLLAGPKKLGEDFWSHFHPNISGAPLDSVRVDFIVHDSTKQAVQDSTKQ